MSVQDSRLLSRVRQDCWWLYIPGLSWFLLTVPLVVGIPLGPLIIGFAWNRRDWMSVFKWSRQHLGWPLKSSGVGSSLLANIGDLLTLGLSHLFVAAHLLATMVNRHGTDKERSETSPFAWVFTWLLLTNVLFLAVYVICPGIILEKLFLRIERHIAGCVVLREQEKREREAMPRAPARFERPARTGAPARPVGASGGTPPGPRAAAGGWRPAAQARPQVVLVAVDDGNARAGYAEGLRRAGLDALLAADRAEAWKRIEDKVATALIVDVDFDKGAAKDMLGRLALYSRGFPVVAVCGWSFSAGGLPALSRMKVLTKPAPSHQVVQALTALLGKE